MFSFESRTRTNSNKGKYFIAAIGQNINRGTQRQFSEYICSEDDLRSRIFGTFFCKISCLPASPRIFEHLKYGIIGHF